MITNGTYRARATGECVLGASKAKGTPFIEFYLEIADGENKGGLVRWTGYFTENTNERTIKSLQTCGWMGEDLSEFADGMLHGLDANEVQIVVELEEYTNEAGETKTSPRVAWINRAGGFLNVSAKLNDGAAKAFGDRMRGLVMKSKASMPQPAAKPGPAKAPPPAPSPADDDDGIPF
jgi:hypothetical protein